MKKPFPPHHPDAVWMRQALQLARKGLGRTSPNPMVGAVLVRRGRIIGRGWHRRAGGPHAEVEALHDAERRGNPVRGATLYVTLEPCCTHGRTPPCTDALQSAGLRRVVVGATDPNPRHAGRAYRILRRAGIQVSTGILGDECARLNEAFNHWITHRTPWVTVKAAMTLDGKIATASGESKWITGARARQQAMRLRQGVDAIVVGINTILADDPSLTFRASDRKRGAGNTPRRIILDAMARTPLTARVVNDEFASLTTIYVARSAPNSRLAALRQKVRVLPGPSWKGRMDLRELLRRLGRDNVTSLLVEGGGEVNASFLLDGLAQRVAFFYAPKILGGRDSRRSVAGEGARRIEEALTLREVEWRSFGPDLFMTALVDAP